MRKLLCIWALVIFAAVILPVILVGFGDAMAAGSAAEVFGESGSPSPEPSTEVSGEPSTVPSAVPSVEPSIPPGAVEVNAAVDEPDRVEVRGDDMGSERAPDEEVTLRVKDGNSVRIMSLDEYLSGVVAAEMPPGFPTEAQKAQAVAARSLVYYRLAAPKHESAEVCTDPGCCMAFGKATDISRAAVADTDGMVMTYEGSAVMAAFFSSCDGRTRSAEEVWGVRVPYLESVESGEGMQKNGHGVGMSQYGAREMALSGAGWREILEWYYRGVLIM